MPVKTKDEVVKDPADLPPITQESLFTKVAKAVMSDPGLSPMGLGVVAGSPGGAALAKTLVDESADLTPARAAIRYMQLKYPKLMSKIPGGVKVVNDPLSRDMGAFNSGTNSIKINLGHPQLQDVYDIPNTVGHELTHGAIQATRTPNMLFQDYVFPGEINSFNSPQFSAYWNQPAEVNARQGGSTAVNTLMNFVSQHPELSKIFGPPK